MAEENSNPPPPPPPPPHHHRASTGSYNCRGKSNSPDKGENVSPHYLRASTGSCHDFCKYGKKHEIEAKPRLPVPKKTAPKLDKQKPVRTLIPTEKKQNPRKNIFSAEIKNISKARLPDPPEIIKRAISVSTKKVEVFSKPKAASYSNEKKKTTNNAPLRVKTPPFSGLNGRKNSDFRVYETKNGSKTGGKAVISSNTSISSGKPSVGGILSTNYRKFKSLKLAPPITKNPKPDPNKDKAVQEKTLHIVQTETDSNSIEKSIMNDNCVLELPKSPSKSNSVSPKPSSSPKFPSSSSNGAENNESEYTEEEEEEEKEEEEIMPKNDEENEEVKLKFRRGKVIELQSENNGPRRLRFRQGRELGQTQDGKGDARRRNFRKMAVGDETKKKKPGSEKVVLRHQDVQEKKDDQGLFNNVIEKTASKLVESRKSKVKALVGAFETVISLQEIKPSS